MTEADPEDPLREQYGDLPRIQSHPQTGRVWTDVVTLRGDMDGQEVLLRGRVHTTRGKGKSAFIVLRQNTATVQLVMFANDKTVSKPMVKYACGIPRESIIEVGGVLVKPEQEIASCTQKDVELHVTLIKAISRSAELPFEVIDAARSELEIEAAAERGEQMVRVSQAVRLDNRYIDLRTPANQAIFRVQSGVCQLFRESLYSRGFTEIHSPKLIAGTSEGGAEVFHVGYMGRPGCLAQSPQLYKQMSICADLDRVFEIGPVFRAENSNTHRHLCEFTGLDMEMQIKEHYNEVLDVLDAMFVHIFSGLQTRYAHELEAINVQYPHQAFQFLEHNPRIEFKEGVQMLRDAGYEMGDFDDLNTEKERKLGELVKAKYGTDFYILTRFPAAVRPFYTMPCPDDGNYSNSFDIFMRGEEIISGAQRIHEPDFLAQRAAECGIEVEGIKDYIDSFRFGAPPHGGAGVGLERVVMLFLGLDNIRKTSMFPRDPNRLTP